MNTAKRKFQYGSDEEDDKRYAFAQRRGEDFSCIKLTEGNTKYVIYNIISKVCYRK